MTEPGHGYGPYTRGCRCDVCRAAKAAYMADRRRQSREAAADHERVRSGRQYVAPIRRHGVAGYQEYACRCMTCRLAKNAADRKQLERRRARRAERRQR